MRILKGSRSNFHLHSDDWKRRIYIDTLGVKTTDFTLSDAKKKALAESGHKGTEAHGIMIQKASRSTAFKAFCLS